jgi:hypothetical protein
MSEADDTRFEAGLGPAHTGDEPAGRILSFPDGGMRSNRQADSRRVALAREMFEDRRTRPKVFGDTTMFSEGAWDILLALYVGEHGEDYATSADSVLASEHPYTTVVRWMSYLKGVGFVAQTQDGAQMTMKNVRLLPKAHTALNAYFDKVRQNRAKGASR